MRICMPLVSGNVTVLWSLADGREPSTMVACISKASEGFQVGHLAGDDSHGRSCLHKVESASYRAVNLQVKRSAGFKAVGKYFHNNDGAWISFTLCSKKVFSFVLLFNQQRTIWLSDQ